MFSSDNNNYPVRINSLVGAICHLYRTHYIPKPHYLFNSPIYIIPMAFVYSCCFWFSLRLGGILIASFSIVQGMIFLTFSCMAHNEPQYTRNKLTIWMNTNNLMYIEDYVESFQASCTIGKKNIIIVKDTEKYISYSITFVIIYILFSVLYIYGAYVCKNAFMLPYIILELIRLLLMTVVLIIWLLVLKQNTMDLGLLIGASVIVSFCLLGMFYLWICAANLPILINEMENDEKLAIITKLQNLVANNKVKSKRRFYNGNSGIDYGLENANGVFVLPPTKMAVSQETFPKKHSPYFTFIQ